MFTLETIGELSQYQATMIFITLAITAIVLTNIIITGRFMVLLILLFLSVTTMVWWQSEKGTEMRKDIQTTVQDYNDAVNRANDNVKTYNDPTMIKY